MTIDMQKFRDSLQEKIAYHGKTADFVSGEEKVLHGTIQLALMEVAMALDEAVVIKKPVDERDQM